jgi:hypothetical protein
MLTEAEIQKVKAEAYQCIESLAILKPHLEETMKELDEMTSRSGELQAIYFRQWAQLRRKMIAIDAALSESIEEETLFFDQLERYVVAYNQTWEQHEEFLKFGLNALTPEVLHDRIEDIARVLRIVANKDTLLFTYAVRTHIPGSVLVAQEEITPWFVYTMWNTQSQIQLNGRDHSLMSLYRRRSEHVAPYEAYQGILLRQQDLWKKKWALVIEEENAAAHLRAQEMSASGHYEVQLRKRVEDLKVEVQRVEDRLASLQRILRVYPLENTPASSPPLTVHQSGLEEH